MKKVVLILTLLLIGCAESFDRFYINPEIAHTRNEYRFSLGHNFTLLTWDNEYDVSITYTDDATGANFTYTGDGTKLVGACAN